MARFRVSVIIPTHNRPERLADTIAALACQEISASDYEIIVVDDGSNPPAVLPERPPLPRCSLVRLEGVERSAARNAGARASQGDLLVFLDDDILVPRHFLAAHLNAHAKWPDAILVGAIRLPALDDAFTSFRQRLEDYEVPRQTGLTSSPNFCAAGNMAIQRARFLDLGGFDPNLTSGEDQDLALRHTERGGQIAFVLEATVLHCDNALTIRDYCRRTEWGYEAMIPFCRRHPNLPANRERQRVNGAFSWHEDGLVGGLKKTMKRLVSLPLVTSLLLVGCRLGERMAPRSRMLDRLYRLTLGAHIFRGYRKGLRNSVGPGAAQRTIPIDPSADGGKENRITQA